jgi:PAS domain S-box-containing protein
MESGSDVARLVADGILAAAADAVMATDDQGIIRLWNPGAERIFGYFAGEALGRSLDLIIPERLRTRHWQGFHEVVRTGKSRYGQGDLLSVPGIHKDVHHRAAQGRSRPNRRYGGRDARRHRPLRRDQTAQAAADYGDKATKLSRILHLTAPIAQPVVRNRSVKNSPKSHAAC